MKVKYVRERGYKGCGSDPFYAIGNVYIVFGVHFRPEGRPVMVSIRSDDDGCPTLLDLAFFDIVDSHIPSGWGFMSRLHGHYVLGPEEFRGDFWEKYHDGDPEAERVFEEVYARLCE